jgi:hypothetical protein
VSLKEQSLETRRKNKELYEYEIRKLLIKALEGPPGTLAGLASIHMDKRREAGQGGRSGPGGGPPHMELAVLLTEGR